MAKWMWILLAAVIIQRLSELILAKRNEQWMKGRGGIEQGGKHYKWFVILHCLFFVFLLFETLLYKRTDFTMNYFLFFLFMLTQIGRIWCVYSLGRFWNTKIIVLPGAPLIKKGPYKYVKHPNYIIVGIELFIIPMLFGAYMTAIIFPVLHILLLKIRLPEEEKALAKASPIKV